MAKGKILGGIVLGVVIIGGCSAAMNDNGGPKAGTDGAKSAASSDNKQSDSKQPSASQADQFTACVAKNGTPTEKAAVKHVTKVTGADKQNNIMDAPEVYTDFTGGLVGPHSGEGKLIATAFTSCYESDNGLVTVYDKNGEMLSNAQF
ncbi:hypothetical protein [Streptomyces triticiradicis]|uniref:Lipoprotein n=1 Tax=Streptomyces triticiradicis TaxID=2651189 RepID=A0A7J5D5C4_9ACTN|nr:hypothetical protein [Streptomyces triticiradicis]KAB1979462.1 hypothetical protein F8144_36230 [Streptomyces triticiradicis]